MKNQSEKTSLSAKEYRQLKKEAHDLKPVVLVGKLGFSENLIKEIDQALLAHNLIKVQVHPKYKPDLVLKIKEIAMSIQAFYIEKIGNIIILYRPAAQ